MTATAAGDGKIVLAGDCGVSDGEALLQLLVRDRSAVVDWSGCTYAHTAVIQVLLAARPRLVGLPANQFLAKYVANLLK